VVYIRLTVITKVASADPLAAKNAEDLAPLIDNVSRIEGTASSRCVDYANV
jgi:hypothetical protein